MNSLDVALRGDPADDAQVFVQVAAIRGEVNVGRVVVRREQDGGRLLDARVVQNLVLCGIAHEDLRAGVAQALFEVSILLHDVYGNVL